MLIYATTADLAAEPWNTTVDNGTLLLRFASGLVREATMTAWYAIDDDGYPADTDLRQTFTDATCAQAVYWSTIGVDPSRGSVQKTHGPLTARSLASASFTYAEPAGATEELGTADTTLCADALRILQTGGLRPTYPIVIG